MRWPIALAWSAITACSLADQPPGFDYLGAGYDLVFGNPDGSADASSVTDPGFRVHVVKFNWDEQYNTCSGLSSNWSCPREATVLPETSCIQQSSSTMISSTKSFQRALQKDCSVSATVSGGYGGFSAEASFSGSTAMSSMKNTLKKEKTFTFQSKAICIDYVAALKLGVTTNILETLSDFNAAVTELPTVYNSCFQLDSVGGPCPQRVDNGFGDLPPVKKSNRRLQIDDDDDDAGGDEANACACDASVAKYFRFIQLYGTHYTTQVEMGGKIVHRVEIKESDVAVLEKKKVDIRYGASLKASYDGFGASASASVAVQGGQQEQSKSYEAVKNVAQKEFNINIGGSPSEDWREWALSATTTPMPVRYRISSLVELVGKVDARKGPLFEKAVSDYIAAYGKTLSYDVSASYNVVAVEVQYSMLVGKMTSATFRVMIGATGDMISVVIKVTNPTGSFRVDVPKKNQVAFGAFAGDVPVTIEFLKGEFTPPKLLLEAQRIQLEAEALRIKMPEPEVLDAERLRIKAPQPEDLSAQRLRIKAPLPMDLDAEGIRIKAPQPVDLDAQRLRIKVPEPMDLMADMSMKKRKPAPKVPSSATSVYFTTIQSFTVLSDDSTVPLDDQYAGKQLPVNVVWPINPMD